jgi:hypothetical protein
MEVRMRAERGASRTRAGLFARYWWAAVVLVTIIAGGGIAVAWRSEPETPPASGTSISSPAVTAASVRRETKPTLDPARFVGKAAVTHQIARDIPDVLDHLYCYCECDKSVGHKSLLSCYTDGHAAT